MTGTDDGQRDAGLAVARKAQDIVLETPAEVNDLSGGPAPYLMLPLMNVPVLAYWVNASQLEQLATSSGMAAQSLALASLCLGVFCSLAPNVMTADSQWVAQHLVWFVLSASGMIASGLVGVGQLVTWLRTRKQAPKLFQEITKNQKYAK